jgi:hypothetical protein
MATGTRAQPLAAHGEIGNGRKDESRPSDRSSTSYGETQTYLLRRIARDQPQLLDQLDTHPDTAAVAIR